MVLSFVKRALGLSATEPAPAPSAAHQIAHGYWQKCSNSFLTNPEYYVSCDLTLARDILPTLGRPARTLDAGCGSGRFSLPLARVSATLEAFDLSPTLIAEARIAAQKLGVENARFWVDDVVDPQQALSTYDVVSCMGVISTIIDEWAFRKVLKMLVRVVKPGGLLILRDSVSLLPEGQLVDGSDYATRYRNRDEYRQAFEQLGCRLEREITLVTFGTSLNGFFLYRAGPRQ